MFGQTFVHREGSGVKPWTLLVSLLGQSFLIGAALLLPLIYTYEIPVHDLTNSILLVAPPPPAPLLVGLRYADPTWNYFSTASLQADSCSSA